MPYGLKRIAALELKESIAKTAKLESPVTKGPLFQKFSALIQDKQFIDRIKSLSGSETQIKVTLTHKKIVVWNAKQVEIASFSLSGRKMKTTQQIVSDIFETAINCLQKAPSAPPSKPNTPVAKPSTPTTSLPPSPTRQPTPRISSPPLPEPLISSTPLLTFPSENPTPSPLQIITSNQQQNLDGSTLPDPKSTEPQVSISKSQDDFSSVPRPEPESVKTSSLLSPRQKPLIPSPSYQPPTIILSGQPSPQPPPTPPPSKQKEQEQATAT